MDVPLRKCCSSSPPQQPMDISSANVTLPQLQKLSVGKEGEIIEAPSSTSSSSSLRMKRPSSLSSSSFSDSQKSLLASLPPSPLLSALSQEPFSSSTPIAASSASSRLLTSTSSVSSFLSLSTSSSSSSSSTSLAWSLLDVCNRKRSISQKPPSLLSFMISFLILLMVVIPEAACQTIADSSQHQRNGAETASNGQIQQCTNSDNKQSSGQCKRNSNIDAGGGGISVESAPLARNRYSTFSAVLEVPTGLALYAGSAIAGGWWYVKEIAHIGDLCPFAASPAEAVEEGLKKGIFGQPMAVEQLSREMRRWDLEMKLPEHHLQPLVLAVTGPTGVGKTETAWVVAEALLTAREAYEIGGGGRKKPKGFVIFRGEDFSDPKEPVSRYHTLIKTRLVNVLRQCNGKAVVLFDEAQKMVNGVLDVLMEAMTERSALTIYSDGKAVEVDCSHVVFFLVSDIGDEAILSILQRYQKRENVPFKQLQWAVKMALDDQWEKLGLSKAVDKVVPYLPMRKEEVMLVLEHKLEQVSKDMAGEYFDSLYTTKELRHALIGQKFIKYGNFSTEASLQAGVQHIYTIYGARDVETGSMRALKWVIGAHLKKNPDKVLDIRYVRALDEVAFYWCPWGYAQGMDEQSRDRMETVESQCQKAWQGVPES